MKYNILYEMKIESIENCQELYEAIRIAFVMEITLTHWLKSSRQGFVCRYANMAFKHFNIKD